MALKEITYIIQNKNKDVTHKIQYIGGVSSNGDRWQTQCNQAIYEIDAKLTSFYILKNKEKINVVVSSDSDGYRFLTTENNLDIPSDLLNL